MKQMLAVLAVMSAAIVSAQSDVMLFDFRDGETHGWRGNSHVAKVEGTKEGLHAVSNGNEDPWIEGPVIPSLPDGGYGLRFVSKERPLESSCFGAMASTPAVKSILLIKMSKNGRLARR